MVDPEDEKPQIQRSDYNFIGGFTTELKVGAPKLPHSLRRFKVNCNLSSCHKFLKAMYSLVTQMAQTVKNLPAVQETQV